MQCLFPERWTWGLRSGWSGGGDDFGGEAREVAPVGRVFGGEDEGDEGGAGLDDFEVELAGEVVAEGGGAHLGDGETSGGDDEGLGDDWAGGRFDVEAWR